MAYTLNSTDSAVQAQDVYDALEANMLAEGWALVLSFTEGADDYHVWVNTAANSGGPKDFHVVIRLASTGTGNLFFGLFEDWLGQNGARYEMQRPGPAYNPVSGTPPFSDPLLGTGTSVVPWIDGTGTNARAGGDGSLGTYFGTIDGTQEQANLDAAPHTLDVRGQYIQYYEVKVDDTTACEYYTQASDKQIMVGTNRVFQSDGGFIYAGMYESVVPSDPAPFCIWSGINGTNKQRNLFNFTRHIGANLLADLPSTGHSEFYNGEIRTYHDTFGAVGGTILGGGLTRGIVDRLHGGPVFARVSIGQHNRYSGNPAYHFGGLRGVLYNVTFGRYMSTYFSPRWGDYIAINGTEYSLLGASGSSSVNPVATSGTEGIWGERA